MKKNNKGFTLAEMLIVVAIIGILVAITSVIITNALEKSREATDLANIRSAIAMVQEACFYQTGTDPASYRSNGPYGASDNEKYLGTKEVVKTKVSGEIRYSMFVLSKQKIDGWQSDNCVVAGIDLNELGVIYDKKHNMFRIQITSTNYDQVNITQNNFSGKLK